MQDLTLCYDRGWDAPEREKSEGWEQYTFMIKRKKTQEEEKFHKGVN